MCFQMQHRGPHRHQPTPKHCKVQASSTARHEMHRSPRSQVDTPRSRCGYPNTLRPASGWPGPASVQSLHVHRFTAGSLRKSVAVPSRTHNMFLLTEAKTAMEMHTPLAKLECLPQASFLKDLVLCCVRWVPDSRANAEALARQLSDSGSGPKQAHVSTSHAAAPTDAALRLALEEALASVESHPVSAVQQQQPQQPAQSEEPSSLSPAPPPPSLTGALRKTCSALGCKKNRLRNSMGYCWGHLHMSLPEPLLLSHAFGQAGLIQEMMPSDMVAVVMSVGQLVERQSYCFAAEFFASFLKVPDAIIAFTSKAPAKSAKSAKSKSQWQGKDLESGLHAAPWPQLRQAHQAPSAKCQAHDMIAVLMACLRSLCSIL